MFRAKITLTFVILTCLLLGGVYFIMHGSIESAYEQDAEVALRRAATIEEQSVNLDEFALIKKARLTASNQQLYKRMLLDEEPDLYAQLHAKYPQASNPVEVRHLAVYDNPLTVDKIRLEDVKKSTRKKRNIDLDLYQRRPTIPDIFLIVDRNGKGVAALGKDNYKWFGDNVAARFPIVLQAIKDNQVKTAMWDWSWNEADNTDLYRVAIVPIRPHPDDKPAGVIITGNVIGGSLAKRSKRLMTGVSTQGSTHGAVAHATFESAPEVAFFQGNRIVGSTFSAAKDDALKKAAFGEAQILKSDEPEKLLRLKIGSDRYLAMVRFLNGEFGNSENPAGFIVLSNLTAATKPVTQAMSNVWAFGAVVLLVGLMALLFFISTFMAPAETIESGIGEILAGNKDYVFELRQKHPIFSSIAQGLNLMSAYLQGKPMPDDVDEMEGWGELIGDSGAGSGGGPAKVTGVAMPGMGGGSKKNDDADGST